MPSKVEGFALDRFCNATIYKPFPPTYTDTDTGTKPIRYDVNIAL